MIKAFSSLLFTIIIGISSVSTINNSKALPINESNVFNVYKGDVIAVNDMVLSSKSGESKTVKGKIITPSGNAYCGNSFSVSEFGTYKVIYKTYFEFEEVQEVLTYNCLRRAVDFFQGDGDVYISYGQYAYNTSKTSHQGVILNMKPGVTVNFDSTIDVSRLTRDTVLLDYIIEPQEIGKNDFSNFTLRLSDALDKSRYVDIYFFDPGVNVCYNSGTHIRAGYEGSFMGGADTQNGEMYLNTATWGTPILTSFHAYPSQDPTHNAKVYFDYENQIIYASPRFLDPYSTGDNKTLVNNFKNVQWYKSAIWNGFPSNKVKLSITPNDFNNSSGKMLIKEILGYDLSKSNFLNDTTAPKIIVDYENQDSTYLPRAKVNTPYRIFNATALDDFDSSVKTITNVYYYSDGAYYDVSINNGTFVPKKEGKYVIRYYAKDVSGNEAEVKLYIFTDNTINDLHISLPSQTIETPIFKEINLPTINDLTTTGGTGNISYERTLLDFDGNEIKLNGDTFTPNKIGTYTLRFLAYDYIGNTDTLDVSIKSNPLENPVLVDEPLLPPGLINGYKYDFNKYKAYETSNNQVIDLSNNVELYVNGEKIASTYVADISKCSEKEGKFYATLEYKVKSLSSEKFDSKTIELRVLDTDGTKDKENYFVGNLESTTKYVTDETGATSIIGVSLFSNNNEDGYSYFVRNLDSSYLNMGFTLDEEATNFKKINLKLIDSTNINNTVTFSLNPNDENPTLTFPGYESDFAISKGAFNIRYADTTKSVFDTKNKELSSISYNDKGEEFVGFKKGCYIRIELERDGLTGDAGIIVTTLGNQPFTISTGIKTQDKIAPTIRFDDEVVSNQNIGDKFVYPHITVYDVLSEIKSIKAKVYYNNDDSVALEINEDMSNTFTIEKYGTYDIEYIATDTCNRSVTYYAHVSVKDTTSPVITIKDDKISGKTFSLGSAIALPTYEVSDDLNYYLLNIILVCPNGERRCLLKNESGNIIYYLNDSSRFPSSFIKDETSYLADMKGNFTLRFIAYDENFNKTIKDLSYKVN